MVEVTIADYLTTELGEDVYAHELGETVDYGVYVRLLDEEYEDGKLVESVVGCFVTEPSFSECRSKVLEVKDAITGMIGYNGWCSGGRARISNLGKNEAGDEMMVVTATIYSEGERLWQVMKMVLQSFTCRI